MISKAAISQRVLFFAGGLLALLYLCAGSLYAVLLPPWETPDAPSHYLYIRYLTSQRALPLSANVLEKSYSYPATLYEWFQPPVYYVIQSWVMRVVGSGQALVSDPVFPDNPRFSFDAPSARYLVPRWPWWTAHPSYEMVLRLRFSNMLVFGLPSVLIVYWTGVRLFENVAIGAVLAVVTMMLPQSLFAHVSIQNDIAAIFCSTALWSIVISTMTKVTVFRWCHIVIVGTLASLGMMSKSNFFPVLMFAVMWAFFYRRELGVVKTLLLFGMPCLLVLIVYVVGGYDHAVAFLDTLVRGSAWSQSTPMPLWIFTQLLFASFWGRLGWMNVPLSPVMIFIVSVLSGMALLISLRQLLLKRNPFDHRARWQTFVWLLFGVVLQLIVIYIVFLPMEQPQGRFFFPALVPFWLLALWSILSRKDTWRTWLVGAVVALVLVFNVLTWYQLCQVYWVG